MIFDLTKRKGGGGDSFYEDAFYKTNNALSSNNVTSIPTQVFRGNASIISVSVPNCTSIGAYAFQEAGSSSNFSVSADNCTTMGANAFFQSKIRALNFPGLKSIGGSVFRGCAARTVNLPKLQTLTQECLKELLYCNSDIILPSVTSGNAVQIFNKTGNSNGNVGIRIIIPNLTGALTQTNGTQYGTMNNATLLDMGSITAISASCFASNPKMQTLILRRKNAIVTLSNVGAFTGTPMRGAGSLTGTIFIDETLYNHLGDGTSLDYRAATNWATLYGEGYLTFAKLQGSQYESLTWYNG